jgi:hypothetical protein
VLKYKIRGKKGKKRGRCYSLNVRRNEELKIKNEMGFLIFKQTALNFGQRFFALV